MGKTKSHTGLPRSIEVTICVPEKIVQRLNHLCDLENADRSSLIRMMIMAQLGQYEARFSSVKFNRDLPMDPGSHEEIMGRRRKSSPPEEKLVSMTVRIPESVFDRLNAICDGMIGNRNALLRLIIMENLDKYEERSHAAREAWNRVSANSKG